jgi:hypothetical protein
MKREVEGARVLRELSWVLGDLRMQIWKVLLSAWTNIGSKQVSMLLRVL